MASAVARTCNGGLGAELSAGSRSRAPDQGIRGRSPLKLKHFWLLTFVGSRKFAQFSKICKRKEITYLCYICKKIMGGHETGGPGAKLGGTCAPSGPGLKPPLTGESAMKALDRVLDK